MVFPGVGAWARCPCTVKEEKVNPYGRGINNLYRKMRCGKYRIALFGNRTYKGTFKQGEI